MFIYNEKCVVNKDFRLQELFKAIKADKAIKASAKNIISIKLSYVISPSKLNLEPSKSVKEIYVIEVAVDSKQLQMSFIEALNKFIELQTLFKIRYKNEVKYMLSIKDFREDKMKIIKRFESDWIAPLELDFPITTKLENVFKEIIKNITNYDFRQEESFESYSKRIDDINKLKSEIDKQTKTMNNEKQPNLRMALNDKIKQMKKELQELEG
ncbi:MAG: DUF4391 domain-containing protein [Eubacteriales bacterium]|nr:DUF4391 domain-containing protein [Eubacteriales bacterium]